MPVGQLLKFGERIDIDLAAIFAKATCESFSGSAEGSVLPTGALLPWIALLPLQDPLQRIIHHSPGRVELRYKTI
jgi:hypothetical protein